MRDYRSPSHSRRIYAAGCNSEDCAMNPRTEEQDTKDEAAAIWNSRFPSPPECGVRGEDDVALSLVSGALCDIGAVVPRDRKNYARAIRERFAELDRPEPISGGESVETSTNHSQVEYGIWDAKLSDQVRIFDKTGREIILWEHQLRDFSDMIAAETDRRSALGHCVQMRPAPSVRRLPAEVRDMFEALDWIAGHSDCQDSIRRAWEGMRKIKSALASSDREAETGKSPSQEPAAIPQKPQSECGVQQGEGKAREWTIRYDGGECRWVSDDCFYDEHPREFIRVREVLRPETRDQLAIPTTDLPNVGERDRLPKAEFTGSDANLGAKPAAESNSGGTTNERGKAPIQPTETSTQNRPAQHTEKGEASASD